MLIDGHNDLAWAHREEFGLDLVDLAVPQPRLHTDLPRLRAGGVTAQFWSVYVPSTLPGSEAVVLTLEQLELVRRFVARNDQLEFATTADDIERVCASGRIASLMGAEGGHSIGGSLAVLRLLHTLGVRYLTLTHNENTPWADSATDDAAVGGLSAFGRDVVSELNALGMMVDLSHVADTTMHAALDATAAPVIFSHSNARAVCDVPRNVPDGVLARVPDNGGVVMATFVPFFVAESVARWMTRAIEIARETAEGPLDILQVIRDHGRVDPPPRATLDDVVNHFEYLRAAIGVAHIGIGGDFDGADQVTIGLEDVSCYPHLFDALRARRWSSLEIEAISGGNVLRVMRDVEAVARGVHR